MLVTVLSACVNAPTEAPSQPPPSGGVEETISPTVVRLGALAEFRLDPSLAFLTPRQRLMVRHLVAAAAEMDDLFWAQSYGDRDDLLGRIEGSEQRRLAQLNYGPWDRFAGNRPFITGFGAKPPGAGFYPTDITREEFETAELVGKQLARTVIRRHPDGGLLAIPYRDAYREPLERAARQMAQAAGLCDEPDFRRYLTLRARALITDDYAPSDRAWAGLQHNSVDLIIGPVDHYEDQLFGYKSAYAAWVLVRNRGFSYRLSRIAGLLPQIRKDLPAGPLARSTPFAAESLPGAFDAVFLAGAANAGPKASMIEMPDDPDLRRSVGIRRIYLRNVMHAQFERIVLPTARGMIADDQRSNVGFDAFFDNLLLAELARSLGPDVTLSGETVRAALREQFQVIDGGLADALGVFIQGWLQDHGEVDALGEMEHLVTYAATLLRDIRLGSGNPRAIARAVQFNYLKAFDAIARDEQTGRYRVYPVAFRDALATLAAQLLTIMGNGDYEAAGRLIESMGGIDPILRRDLASLDTTVPVGLIFEQGPGVLVEE